MAIAGGKPAVYGGKGATGQLATVRADWQPHVIPVWFDLDGETTVLGMQRASVTTNNLQRDGRASLLCLEPEELLFACTDVFVHGTTEICDDPEQWLYWATRIAGRYLGEDQAETYGKRNSTPESVLVRVTPAIIIGEVRIPNPPKGWDDKAG